MWREKKYQGKTECCSRCAIPFQFLRVEVENISDPIRKGVLAKITIYVEGKKKKKQQTISRVCLYSRVSTCTNRYIYIS